MPKFSVTINEQVQESRTYQVTARNALEAAAEAHLQWIIHGREPAPEHRSIQVEERDYAVLGRQGLTEFHCSEVEADYVPTTES